MLILHVRRYTLDDKTWQPKKIDALVKAPETIDLEFLRSSGPQPGEELQPEAAPAPSAAVPVADEGIVAQLVSMGFSENGSRRAALATNNASADVAMNWVLEHMGDANFNDPIEPPAPAAAGVGVSAESVEMLVGMGFQTKHAEKALKECAGNLERAADWLFSRMDSLDAMDLDEPAAPAAPGGAAEVPHYKAQYQLLGFISHIGSSTACGHYVCHIKKEGTWTIFNDRKVAVSEEPPFDLGYMYVYESVGPCDA